MQLHISPPYTTLRPLAATALLVCSYFDWTEVVSHSNCSKTFTAKASEDEGSTAEPAASTGGLKVEKACTILTTVRARTVQASEDVMRGEAAGSEGKKGGASGSQRLQRQRDTMPPQ